MSRSDGRFTESVEELPRHRIARVVLIAHEGCGYNKTRFGGRRPGRLRARPRGVRAAGGLQADFDDVNNQQTGGGYRTLGATDILGGANPSTDWQSMGPSCDGPDDPDCLRPYGGGNR
jgi:hypothetical protein